MKKIILALLLHLLAFPSLGKENKLKVLPVFEIYSDFKNIKQYYHDLANYVDTTNVIKELKSYELNHNGITIYLHEWKGKLHEVNYQLRNLTNEDSIKVSNFLFDKYGKGLKWIEKEDNSWGKWFDLSNHLIRGVNVYSQGYRTVSFSSLEKLEEETRTRQTGQSR